MFYETRDNFNKQKQTIDYNIVSNDWLPFAANLIFLNRTCFNGLYRLNSRGHFNVPIGSYKNPRICDSDNLNCVSESLQNVTLISVDFEQTLAKLQLIPKKTFIYLDPPYRPLPNTPSFTSYSSSSFGENEQIKLANWYRRLASQGYYLMLSNSDPKNINEYDNFFEFHYHGFNINKVLASRLINSNANGRNQISEIVITNY